MFVCMLKSSSSVCAGEIQDGNYIGKLLVLIKEIRYSKIFNWERKVEADCCIL